jgi:lipopolysaccharide export system protein LptA
VIAPLLLAVALAAPTAPAKPAEAPLPPAAASPKAPADAAAGPARPAGTAVRPIASDKPVRLDADEVRFSFKTQQVTVVGKPLVTLVHDDAVLTCRRLTGENDANGKLRVAVCEGDVRLVRASRLVTCERATYDREASRVVCTGDPVLRDPGGTEARGTTLTYDMAADEVRLEGAAQVTVPGDQVDAGGQALKEPGGRK